MYAAAISCWVHTVGAGERAGVVCTDTGVAGVVGAEVRSLLPELQAASADSSTNETTDLFMYENVSTHALASRGLVIRVSGPPSP
jgi:hypothetical protein